jgi:hypothetical protein
MKSMKSKMILAGALAATMVTSAFADVNICLVGSSAWRSITYDRILNGGIYDTNLMVVEKTIYNGSANSLQTFRGKSPAICGDSSQYLIIRCNFIGSIEGMDALKTGVGQDTVDPIIPGGGNETKGYASIKYPADLALSDVFPSAANPSLEGVFANVIQVGVIPFCMISSSNTSARGISNINRDQMADLFTQGNYMPASYLGATDQSADNKVFLLGRSIYSGTRVTVERVSGNPNAVEYCWNTNGATGSAFRWIQIPITNNLNNGLTSGGTLVGIAQWCSSNIDGCVAVGYAGFPDCSVKSSNQADNNAVIKPALNILSYNGVPFSLTNVENGSYLLWGYENMIYNGLSGSKLTFAQTLSSSMMDEDYQLNTSGKNNTYSATSVAKSRMKFLRTVDGGALKAIPAWTYGKTRADE